MSRSIKRFIEELEEAVRFLDQNITRVEKENTFKKKMEPLTFVLEDFQFLQSIYFMTSKNFLTTEEALYHFLGVRKIEYMDGHVGYYSLGDTGRILSFIADRVSKIRMEKELARRREMEK